MWDGRITGGDSRSEAVLGSLEEQLRRVAEIERQRAELTVSAATPDMRVTATVDANGYLIDLEFSSDIGDMSYEQIAAAVVATTRQAIAESARRSGELFEPLNEYRMRMPKLSELFEGMPDSEFRLVPPGADIAAEPPAEESPTDTAIPEAEVSPVSANPDRDGPLMRFDDAVDIDQVVDDPTAVTHRDWM